MASAGGAGRVDRLIAEASTVVKDADVLLRRADRLADAERTATLDEILGLVENAERKYKDLERTHKKLPMKDKRSSTSGVNDTKNAVKDLRSRYTAAKTAADREALMGGPEAEEERERRLRLKGKQEHMDGTSEHLADARRTLHETIAVGVATTDTMASQSQSLLRTRDHVEGTQAQADRASGAVKNMQSRAWTNKCILGFAILLLLAGVVVVVVYGHLPHSKGK